MDKVAELETKQFWYSIKYAAIFWLGISSGLLLDNEQLMLWLDKILSTNSSSELVLEQNAEPLSPGSETYLLRQFQHQGIESISELSCSQNACQLKMPLPQSRRTQESLIPALRYVFSEYFDSNVELETRSQSTDLHIAVNKLSGAAQ